MFTWSQQSQPFFVLAPMDDVTDVVFRDVVARAAAPDIFMTEFVSTDGLASAGRDRVITKLRRNPSNTHPLIAQIWGKDPDKYYQAARDIVALGGFSGIDINMGCPERGIVARGCCGGLIGRFDEAKAIIEATKAGAGALPVSVKSRIGLDRIITEEWYGFLLEQDVANITIHARTVREMSKVPARWSEIAKVVKLRDQLSPATTIVGNGDVRDRADGLRLAAETGVDGVMIGRGIFHDIYAFANGPVDRRPEAMLAILLDHMNQYETEWGTSKSFQILKKFFKIYVNGWYGAAELRTRLMEANEPAQAREILASHAKPPLV